MLSIPHRTQSQKPLCASYKPHMKTFSIIVSVLILSLILKGQSGTICFDLIDPNTKQQVFEAKALIIVKVSKKIILILFMFRFSLWVRSW